MLKKLNSKKILALVMAAAMSLSVMTGCTDKNVTDTEPINGKGLEIMNIVKFDLLERKFKEDLGVM